RIPRISIRKVRAVVEATLHQPPPHATHWSTRSMAKAQGLSEATIRRIWRQHQLKPHLLKTFKLSRDTQFLDKLHDVVGLYLNPPDKSLVLCVDEKSQIQALDRTQPGLPMKKGRCGTL
ncbi:IS630 family transposase, partial [Acidobacteriia bacterium AH_259_A11_L15]|nr:IS630 family transposase [Acidobacteriia bacterium AH_259_A11_L15]